MLSDVFSLDVVSLDEVSLDEVSLDVVLLYESSLENLNELKKWNTKLHGCDYNQLKIIGIKFVLIFFF